jgi:hypothetical protein
MLKQRLLALRRAVKARVFRSVESRFGIHITLAHYSSPIPTLGELDPKACSQVNACPGLNFQVGRQLQTLATVFPKYLGEYAPPGNPGLAQVDAFVLYATIREKKPALIIEVGAGESTKIALAALSRNQEEGAGGLLKAIDPYPRSFLKEISRPGFQLIEKKVQAIEEEAFKDADILFIDSSHVSKTGSDVNYEILNIVPTLKVGALVHWHDIMIPTDYPMFWITHGTFWNESYMVHAFMLNNECFRVVWAAKYMQLNYPDLLRHSFPYFDPDNSDQQLSSFWVERVS